MQQPSASHSSFLRLLFGWPHEGRSKFVVERKCVTKLVSPLSFYMVSCFYIFLPLPKHSFEANLLGSSSLPIFLHALGNTCGFCSLPCGSSFALLGRSLQPATLLEGKLFFGMFWPLTAVNSKCFQSAHKISVRHYDTLPTSRFVTSWSAGALLERF